MLTTAAGMESRKELSRRTKAYSEVVAPAVLEERQGAGAGDGLGPRVHSQLAVDALQVRLDCATRDVEAAGDLLVDEAGREQLQHLLLARAERLRQAIRGRRAPLCRPAS